MLFKASHINGTFACRVSIIHTSITLRCNIKDIQFINAVILISVTLPGPTRLGFVCTSGNKWSGHLAHFVLG